MFTLMLRVVAPVDQRYDVLTDEVSVTLLPAHMSVGPDAVIVGVAGSGFTATLVATDGTLRHPKALATCTV